MQCCTISLSRLGVYNSVANESHLPVENGGGRRGKLD